jgi:hypothetical protein
MLPEAVKEVARGRQRMTGGIRGAAQPGGRIRRDARLTDGSFSWQQVGLR